MSLGFDPYSDIRHTSTAEMSALLSDRTYSQVISLVLISVEAERTPRLPNAGKNEQFTSESPGTLQETERATSRLVIKRQIETELWNVYMSPLEQSTLALSTVRFEGPLKTLK
jgi:hypothetical protein